ncbi:hypothetical protein E4T56_gene17221 [Termitomyces sp. T112]|nr:hypothetical protein E4T56_gene17221 [Termitomyces sp. T112]
MSLIDLLYMSVAAAYESPGKSFEELRVDDYIRAYNATGRGPPPCPQTPADSVSRARAGLPPLFEPLSNSKLTNNNATSDSTPSSTVRDPTALPTAQEFTSTELEGEFFQTLSSMPLYQFYSLEELRTYAYLRGNKVSPTPITMAPFVIAPVTPTCTSSDLTINSVSAFTDQLITITSQPQYSGHSLEELRVAFLQAGRELTSAEITARSPAPPQRAFGTSSYPFTPSTASRRF